MANRCIVWTSFGESYVKQAINSANSYLRHCPNVDLVLLTDNSDYSDLNLTIFTKVIRTLLADEFVENYYETNRLESAKIYFLKTHVAQLKYKAILYVDSDTYCFSDISDVWVNVLPNYDISLGKSPEALWKNSSSSQKLVPSKIVALESQDLKINAGVILFNGALFSQTVSAWSSTFIRLSSKFRDTGNYSINDQGALRSLIESGTLKCHFFDSTVYNATPFVYVPLHRRNRLSSIAIGHTHKIFEHGITKQEQLVSTPGILTWPYSDELLNL